MLLTLDMADAFGDRLALDQIRRALTAARPGLADALVPDPERPLLRILRSEGDALIVARSAEDAAGRWIVGIPGRPDPVLHEVDSSDEVVGIVLDALERPGSPTEKDTATDGQG